MNSFKSLSIYLILVVSLITTMSADAQTWRERWQERRAERTAERQNNNTSYQEYALMHDGLERWYIAYSPENLRPSASAVVLLHGGTQSMRKMFQKRAASGNAWRDLADREGFLLIVPNATHPETGDTKGDKQNWNDFRKPGSPRSSSADDVGFITALVEKMIRDYQLNPEQIFVTGSSNGGMMTYRVLIDRSEVFAAGAAFIANFPEGDLNAIRQPSRPTPIMIMNGTEDPLIPYEGGQVGPNMVAIMSTAGTVDWWVQANNADPTPSAPYYFPDINTEDNCKISLVKYEAKNSNGAPVYLYTVHGGGHIMPSQKYMMRKNRITDRLIGRQCYDVEGAEVAWEFFKRHSR